MGAKFGVNGKIDGLHPGGDHHRSHQGKDLLHPLGPKLQPRGVGKALFVKGRELHHCLQKPAHQESRCQTVDAELPIQGPEIEDDDGVGNGADESRDIELIQRLQNAHKREGKACEKDRGEHNAGEARGQGGSLGVVTICKEGDELLRKGHAKTCEGQGQNTDDGEEGPTELEGLFLAAAFQVFAEYRNKAGRDSGGKHRVKKHSRDAAGGIEGAGLHAHAVVDCQEMIPVQAHDLAQERQYHHDADGPRSAFLFFQGPTSPHNKSAYIVHDWQVIFNHPM